MPVTNGTLTVTAYTPPAPAGRRWDVLALLPQKNRDEDATGDLAKLAAVLQEVTTLLLARVDRFPELIDYDLTPDAFLDALLAQLGNPFTHTSLAVLAPIDKRRLAAILVPIYRQKGTDPGIINAVRFFTGLEVTIRCVYRDEVWILEDPRFVLGDDIASPSWPYFKADAATARFQAWDSVGSVFFAYPWIDGEPVTFLAAPIPPFGYGTLPAPLVEGTTYYIRDLSGTYFRVSATPGGAAVALTTDGSPPNLIIASTVDGNCLLGPDTKDLNWCFGFEVLSPTALTATQRLQVIALAMYMKPSHTDFLELVEP